MRCFILLALVAAAAAMDQIRFPGSKIIIADTEVMGSVSIVNRKMKQTNAAYVCSTVLSKKSESYNELRQYLDGSNEEDESISDLILYPIQEIYIAGAMITDVCVYLPRENHCYPPEPDMDTTLHFKKEHQPIIYFAKPFWGHASDARVALHLILLKTALMDMSSTVTITDEYIVASYPNHLHEVQIIPTSIMSPVESSSVESSSVEASSEPPANKRYWI